MSDMLGVRAWTGSAHHSPGVSLAQRAGYDVVSRAITPSHEPAGKSR